MSSGAASPLQDSAPAWCQLGSESLRRGPSCQEAPAHLHPVQTQVFVYFLRCFSVPESKLRVGVFSSLLAQYFRVHTWARPRCKGSCLPSWAGPRVAEWKASSEPLCSK